MPAWSWIALGALSLIATLIGALVLFARTQVSSGAGIVTSRWGRSLRVARGGGRAIGRYLWRHLRRALTPAARRAELDRRYHQETARTVVEAMGNMKGVLMKLGQIVSFMDDMLPPEYQAQLRTLQSQAPPMSYELVVQVIREELGEEPEVLFAHFDPKPLASASIGQVHRARLDDGTEVVVKVQYPGVDQAIAADLDNAGMLMAMAGAVTPTLDPAPIVEELRARMLEELDYRMEAEHQELFRALFAASPAILVPRVFPQRSSRRVLTSEFVEGVGFYEFVEQAGPEARRRAYLAVQEFVFDSLWIHNVFNGDPHPGNYRFLPDGRVAFLDFGCVKRFDPGFIEPFRELNRRYLLGDKEGYFRQFCELKFIKPGHEDKIDKEWLWRYSSWFYRPLEKDEPFEMSGEYCRQAVAQIFGENMRLLNMPGDYLMLNRITFGLNSIMARLGAKENWRRLCTAYYFPDGDDPIFAAAGTGPAGEAPTSRAAPQAAKVP